MNTKICKLLAFSFVVSSVSLGVDTMDPVTLLARCYAIFTETKLPQNHRLRSLVATRQMSVEDACMDILESAKLNSTDGKLTYLNDVTRSDEGKKILKNLMHYHKDFFPTYDIHDNVVITGRDFSRIMESAFDFVDPWEPPFYWMKVLLTANGATMGRPLNEVVTGKYSLEGVRTKPAGFPSTTNSGPFTNGVPAGSSGTVPWPEPDPSKTDGSGTVSMNNRYPDLSPYFVQWGELIGIAEINESHPKYSFIQYSTYHPTVPVPTNKNFGAGLITSQPYLIAYLKRSDKKDNNPQVYDGNLTHPRLWVKAVVNDLLCRDLPVLRSVDIADQVDENSDLPFRRSGSCMRCHGTMDPMASSIRNLIATRPYPNHRAMVYQLSTDPTSTLFSRQPPTGRLKFRNYRGELVDVPLSNPSDLGTALAAQDDFYVCTANKYFKFLTGIYTKMMDFGFDSGSEDLEPLPIDIAYFKLIEKYGLCLKQHKNLPKLFKQILSSKFFKNSKMRMSIDDVNREINSFTCN